VLAALPHQPAMDSGLDWNATVARSKRDERISVYVADDHPIYREGLVGAIKARPDLELVGEAENGRDALEEIRELRPDVAAPGMGCPDRSAPD